MRDAEIIVIGGGTVGAAIAYGLQSRGIETLLLDGARSDPRAARANFGLVWVQGKGPGMPAYQALTRQSSDLWPEFERGLKEHSGFDAIEYERKGGLAFCLGEDEFEKRSQSLIRLHNQAGADERDTEMLDRPALEKLMPRAKFGPEIAGASYCWRDGHVNPLLLLRSLHAAVRRLGGRVVSEVSIEKIDRAEDGYVLSTRVGRIYRAAKIVVAAGLGSKELGAEIGLDLPIRPQRGQILVTRRMAPTLDLPASGLRQSGDGTILIGTTKEEVGTDTSTTAEKASVMARKAQRVLPRLADVQLVRQWSGLRIMTPDSYPIYAEAPDAPGCFVALCHSGVTLAAAHAQIVAGQIAEGRLSQSLQPFHHGRFNV